MGLPRPRAGRRTRPGTLTKYRLPPPTVRRRSALIRNLRLPSFDKSARPGAGHQLVPADHLARMVDQNDQKVESATAKTNRLRAFLEKSLCRKQAERAERDRSLVRDEGSDHKSNFFLLNSTRQVEGAVTPPIYPADLLPTRNERWRRVKIGIGDASRCHPSHTTEGYPPRRRILLCIA